MLIRKQFKFEGAHIVRNCSSQRCRENIHGHSYIVEVFITSDKLDDGYMVMDFCRLDKVKEFIESFDHSYSLWQKEPPDFKTFVYRYNRRVAEIPVPEKIFLTSDCSDIPFRIFDHCFGRRFQIYVMDKSCGMSDADICSIVGADE